MQTIFPVLCFLAGFALAWLVLRSKRQEVEAAFRALASDALARNNQAFLDLAKASLGQAQQAARGELELRQQAIQEMIAPLRASLDRVDSKIQDLEKARAGAYAALQEQVRNLLAAQADLRNETGRLATALRAPQVRGRWGEIQLRRVVELAGMLEHCDFACQTTIDSPDGRLRPDLVVYLPGGKTVIVDSKAPLDGYLRAIEAPDESTRRARLADHARQIRQHMTALGRKSYWEPLEQAPEFTVLFLPGECFFSAALESDPTLIEIGVEQNIILATPTTLIALLRAVAYGWKQERLAQNAAEISALGKELFKRLSDMGEHWNRVGKGLERAVEAYNSAVGSFETRVMVAARKFVDLKTAPMGASLPPLEPVDQNVRAIEPS
jgi:DNA recombination protein RmuC